MKTLTVGGVPEHFNLPWHLAIESGELAAAGADVRWRDFPDGSGAMAAALTRGEVDVALLLTEGAVAGIASGGSYGIVSLYTETPLIWGVHVPAGSPAQSAGDLERATFAISRLGSGSHLMCLVYAQRNGWAPDSMKLSAVRSLEGAIAAFAAGTADVFLWERFMTQPVVDSGRFRRIDELVAPWPAFVVCVARSALSDRRDLIRTVLGCVFAAAERFAASPDAAESIARRYDLRPDDAACWLGKTRWARTVGIEPAVVAGVVDTFQRLGFIGRDFSAASALARL